MNWLKFETKENDEYYAEFYPVSNSRNEFVLYKKRKEGGLTYIVSSVIEGNSIEDAVKKGASQVLKMSRPEFAEFSNNDTISLS